MVEEVHSIEILNQAKRTKENQKVDQMLVYIETKRSSQQQQQQQTIICSDKFMKDLGLLRRTKMQDSLLASLLT